MEILEAYTRGIKNVKNSLQEREIENKIHEPSIRQKYRRNILVINIFNILNDKGSS